MKRCDALSAKIDDQKNPCSKSSPRTIHLTEVPHYINCNGLPKYKYLAPPRDVSVVYPDRCAAVTVQTLADSACVQLVAKRITKIAMGSALSCFLLQQEVCVCGRAYITLKSGYFTGLLAATQSVCMCVFHYIYTSPKAFSMIAGIS